MGNFVSTGSRASENRERAALGDLNGSSEDKSKANDVKTNRRLCDESDASDLALKQMQKGKLLMAYFWNQTFAWCNPSQLKPIRENFIEFSKTSDSRSFLSAVGEIGEHVEHMLVCDEALVSCVDLNSGIKEGTIVPDVRREIVSSLALVEPGIILEDVKSLAKTASFSDLLEIEVLKRKISAFYRSKGRFDLPKYDEHRYIIGLEVREDEYALEFDSSSFQRSLRKCYGFASKKRKYSDEVNKVDLVDVATTFRRRVSEVSKIEKADLKQLEELSSGKSFSSRKRKSIGIGKREESNDSNHLEEREKKEDSGIEITADLSTQLASLCKRVRVDVSASVERNNGNGEIILQTGKIERKKIKYLSPEYITDFSWSARKSKIGSESSQIRAAERMTKNSAEKTINFVRLGAPPEEKLDPSRAAALSTPYSKDYYDSSYDM